MAKIKNFEENLDELEAVVSELESKELNLDEAFEKFKLGMKLTKECSNSLKNFESKIKILIEEDGEMVEEDFDESEQD